MQISYSMKRFDFTRRLIVITKLSKETTNLGGSGAHSVRKQLENMEPVVYGFCICGKRFELNVPLISSFVV